MIPLAQVETGTKVCSGKWGCNKEKPLSEFRQKRGGRYETYCFSCDQVRNLLVKRQNKKPPIVRAIEAEAPPPCMTCENYETCAANKLACADFVNYTRQVGREDSLKPGRVASKFLYKMTFPGGARA